MPLTGLSLRIWLNRYVHFLPDGSSVHFRTKGMPGRFAPGPLSKDLVRELLQRRFYTGQVIYRGVDEHGRRRRRHNIVETFQGQQPILIGLETFDQAQKIRQTLYRSPRAKYGRPAEVYPLSGLLRCMLCRRPMRAFSSSGRRYYRDSTRIDHCGECDQPSVLADDIEAQVADFLSHIALPEGWPDNAMEWLGLGGSDNGQEAQRRWERAKGLYLRGDIGREQYDAEKKRYESSAQGLTKSQVTATMALGDLIRDFAQEWDRALPIEKRKLLRVAVAAVFVRGNRLVGIQPTPALLPFVSRSSEESHCNYGDDGHGRLFK